MEATPSGTEHLLYCMQTLDDVCSQLLGGPEEAIRSIRRRGILAVAPVFPEGRDEEQRDLIAERKIQLLRKLQERRERLEGAVEVLRDILDEVARAPKVEDRLLGGN